MDSKDNKDGRVISLDAAREAKIEERRRKYQRVLFKNILGVYCVAEGKGLKAVELVDVSADGLSFQLPLESKNLESLAVGSSFSFRFYFSQDTFIPIEVRIQNQRACIEEGNKYIRFGCTLNTESKTYEAYKYFVLFLTKYAETSTVDKGDMKFLFF
jgi:hypothetical protein